MDIQIRSLQPEDMPFLRTALYLAIFVPPGVEAPPKSIIDLPEVAAYIEDFGRREGDIGCVALADGVPVGAAWARLLRGYGYVDDQTPELSIALLSGYRGLGIGTQMLTWLFEALRPSAAQVSLSVNLANPAYRLYRKLGFQTVMLDEGSAIMLRRL